MYKQIRFYLIYLYNYWWNKLIGPFYFKKLNSNQEFMKKISEKLEEYLKNYYGK